MKKYIEYISIAVVLTGLTACNELDTKPFES